MNAEAYDQANGTGSSLASSKSPVEIKVGPYQDITLTLTSTISKFTIEYNKPVMFGEVAEFTAVARDINDNIILLPSSDSTTWAVQGDVLRKGAYRAGVEKYYLRVIPIKKGNATVTCTLREGVNGDGSPATRLASFPVTVLEWQTPLEGPNGPRRIGYDPLLALGDGWNSKGTSEDQMIKPSPLIKPTSGFPQYKRQDGTGMTEWYANWNSQEAHTEEGKSISAEVTARYMSYSGHCQTSYENAISTSGKSMNIEFRVYKDFGEYWLDPQQIVLTSDAADMLATDPDGFASVYGDQVIIGEQRMHYVTVLFTFSKFSQETNTKFGVHVDGSGDWGTGSIKFSGDYKSFVKEQLKNGSATIRVTKSNLGVIPGLADATLTSDAQIDDIFTACSAATSIVDNAPVTTSDVVGYTAAPISYLCKSVPISVSSVGTGLSEYMQAYTAQRRALKHLDEMVQNVTDYYWLPTARYNECVAARATITTNINTVLVPRIRQLLEGGVVPALSDNERWPFLKWPNPRLTVHSAKYGGTYGGNGFNYQLAIELRDIKGSSDVHYWHQYFDMSPGVYPTDRGWVDQQIQSNGVIKYWCTITSFMSISDQWGALHYFLENGFIPFQMKNPTTGEAIIEKKIPVTLSNFSADGNPPDADTWWYVEVPY
jgi:hypothetical protein